MDIDFRSVMVTLAIPNVTALGCITAYVYSEQKGIKSSATFLKRFFPNRRDEFYFRIDFFLSALVGTGIGLVLYSPTTAYQALAAGIGWTAAFNIVKSENTKHSAPGTTGSAAPKQRRARPAALLRSAEVESDKNGERQ